MRNPFLSVFAGRHAESLAEYVLKIIRVIVADADGDAGNAHIGINQQILCFADAAQNNILHGRKADIIFEKMRQIIGIDISIRRNVMQADRFFIMLVNVLNDFLRQR